MPSVLSNSCPACGTRYSQGDAYCQNCGSRLPRPGLLLHLARSIKEVSGRGKLMALVFFAELVVVGVVSVAPFFPGEQSFYMAEVPTLKAAAENTNVLQQVYLIFSNNIRIAYEELVPFFGQFLFAASTYETARVLEVLSISEGIPEPLALVTLLLLPDTWIELFGYAIAVVASSYLIKALRNRDRLAQELYNFVLTAGLVAVTIFVAAIFESIGIQLENSLAFLVLWIPFAVMLLGVLRLRKRIKEIPV